jgi:hypothetical protein
MDLIQIFIAELVFLDRPKNKKNNFTSCWAVFVVFTKIGHKGFFVCNVCRLMTFLSNKLQEKCSRYYLAANKNLIFETTNLKNYRTSKTEFI